MTAPTALERLAAEMAVATAEVCEQCARPLAGSGIALVEWPARQAVVFCGSQCTDAWLATH